MSRRAAAVEGQIGMTLGLLSERPGSQVDLIAEAGLEEIGPSTLRVEEDREPALF